MSVVPRGTVDKIQFYENREQGWSQNAQAIGTTAGAVTLLTTKTAAARSAYDAQQLAKLAAKDATEALHQAEREMADAGSDIIKQIRAKAAVDGDGVYILASLPVPATPTPVVTLGTPTNFKVTLESDGSLTLKWKCISPRASGMTYEVWRAPAGSAEFAYIGGSGKKSFNDPTVPAGSASVAYRIRAVRSTATGAWANFTVYFGTGAAGQTTASLVQPRAAA